MLDWADDVAELLGTLGIARFATMGWSLGGQYAAALGYAMSLRVTRVAILAGALPLDEPGLLRALPAIDRTFIGLSQHAPWLARQGFRSMRFTALTAPGLYGRLAARDLGAADGDVIRAQGYAEFAKMSREALRQPQGVVEEYIVMVRPWGFAPEDLTVPVDVWAGTDDQLLDPTWPQRLADRIPDATLHLMPGGHFLAHLYYRDIFERLCR
jgi:pimeloyl-ACP methyl ester carboxylesterase